MKGRSCNHCSGGRLICITHSEVAFVALGTQHAMRLRHIVIMAIPALQYFSTLSHKRHDLKKKSLFEHKMCFDFLYNLCLKHFSF